MSRSVRMMTGVPGVMPADAEMTPAANTSAPRSTASPHSLSNTAAILGHKTMCGGQRYPTPMRLYPPIRPICLNPIFSGECVLTCRQPRPCPHPVGTPLAVAPWAAVLRAREWCPHSRGRGGRGVAAAQTHRHPTAGKRRKGGERDAVRGGGRWPFAYVGRSSLCVFLIYGLTYCGPDLVEVALERLLHLGQRRTHVLHLQAVHPVTPQRQSDESDVILPTSVAAGG